MLSDGSIFGQFGFVPVLIKVGDREVPGLRPHSTIVSRAFRSSVTTLDPADQPAVAMYMYGIQTLRNEGFSIAYMIPHPRWVGLFRIHRNLQRGYFPLFSISVDSVRSLKLTRGYTVSGLELSDAGIDDLWRQWAPQYACGIVRNASALKWKMDIDRYCALAVHRRGDLVGVVIARTRGDGMWLICDMLTAGPGESLKATILAAAIAGTTRTSRWSFLLKRRCARSRSSPRR